MSSLKKLLSTVATRDNFSEAAYLKSNPDVAEAVKSGAFRSGRHHFDLFRRKRKSGNALRSVHIADVRKRKHEKIREICAMTSLHR